MENNHILSVDIDWVQSRTQFTNLFKEILIHLSLCKQIIFIDTHHNILDYLEEGKNSIVNIDHHHDLGIFDKKKNVTPLDSIHEGNWVHHLILQQRLEEYTWINNPTSEIYHQEHLICRNLDRYKLDTNLDIIKNRKFKKVVICKSFDYIDPEFKFKGYGALFDIFKSTALVLFKSKTIVNNVNNPLKMY